jgi:diguanylate cyclase (GGDEF)-like protein
MTEIRSALLNSALSAKPSESSISSMRVFLSNPIVKKATDAAVTDIDRKTDFEKYKVAHAAGFDAAVMVAGESKKKIKDLERLVRVDPLTELSSRLGFNEHLDAEASRIDRYGGTATVLVLDAVALKMINETLGHMEGDAAIVEIAKAIKKGKRESDKAGRWGGDEFMILLPDTDIEGARAVWRQINKILSAIKIDDTGLSLSVRGGAVIFDKEHPQESLEKAIDMMEKAKESTRDSAIENKTVFFTPEDLE